MSSDIKDIPGTFRFDDIEVAEKFDNHVRGQLPWYDMVTRGVVHYVRAFLPMGGTIVDFGCSTGNLGVALHDTLAERSARYVGVEPSQEMLGLARKRLDVHRLSGATVEEYLDREPPECDVAVFMLSRIFMRPSVREEAMARVKALIRKGGALITVDRYAPTPGEVGLATTRLTLMEKWVGGIDPEDILRKELSINGVQRVASNAEDDRLGEWVEWFAFGDFRGRIWVA